MLKHFLCASRICGAVTGVLTSQPNRTTVILRRKWPPGLYKKSQQPKKLRGRHHVYEFVENTEFKKQPEIEVILTGYVKGLGDRGDRVFVKPNYAYNELLLPGLAVYVTPNNIERYCTDENNRQRTYSSPFVQRTLGFLSNMNLPIIMNKEVPWTVEPWHVRASLRKRGVYVPEAAIKIPDKPITGPDLDKEGKIFYVTITINGREKVDVKCRIHHWSTKLSDRLPYVPEFWNLPDVPVLEES
ncbi:39S ribosomal protein L9, mitochondrial [Schistocerca nitens]|uniref:39S ribosomal protein L9, mitochondrial n=1 Tax=Schistocerca nitens TaxID=7011 RepID=UPI0021177C0F|nr:39S ribosomal protein L9, mitochondrial [Schistocerca nitens]